MPTQEVDVKRPSSGISSGSLAGGMMTEEVSRNGVPPVLRNTFLWLFEDRAMRKLPIIMYFVLSFKHGRLIN
jgi:hypothetical protein